MTDARSGIERIVYAYADRVDHGDFVGMAELFRHATYKGGGPDDPGVFGSEPMLAIQEQFIRKYPDGTPRTKHVITNLVVDADEKAGSASARSYFTVLQQVDDFPLQVVVAGRYHDQFERVDEEWRLTERIILCDLIGDVSRHLQTDPFQSR